MELRLFWTDIGTVGMQKTQTHPTIISLCSLVSTSYHRFNPPCIIFTFMVYSVPVNCTSRSCLRFHAIPGNWHHVPTKRLLSCTPDFKGQVLNGLNRFLNNRQELWLRLWRLWSFWSSVLWQRWNLSGITCKSWCMITANKTLFECTPWIHDYTGLMLLWDFQKRSFKGVE